MMKLAVCSTACNGKSFFVKSFLNTWQNYVTPEKTYRDLVEEKGLKLNKDGDVESQRIIRDALIDQAIGSSGETHCIHDRCVLDNLAYTLWLSEKEKIDDDDFIAESFLLTRETLKMYDIILFLPIHPASPVVLEEADNRELDPTYRDEINVIYHSIFENYKEHTGMIFPLEDSPAMIEIYGDETEFEKTLMVANYLDDNGDLKTTDENLMKTISEMSQEDALTQKLLNQVKFE